MATKNTKSVNLLPEIFRTDKNSKFLDSTIDQLISKPELQRIDGYIGSKNTPTYNANTDYYLPETSSTRSNYQFNPALILNDSNGNITDTISFDDLINEINLNGGNTENLDRLFKTNVYAFNPHIDWDKLINYQEYYWLPTGPDTITVTGLKKNTTSTFTVADDELGTSYIFTPDGLTADPVITLFRGNTYKFNISSQYKFYIKTAPSFGNDDIYTTNITNNGIKEGTITLVVDENTPSSLFYVSGEQILSQGQFIIKTIEEDSFLDVEAEIIGKQFYTYGNGTQLTNGMKVRFGGTVVPEFYKNREFFVEGVGEAIRLIDYAELTGAANLVNIYNDNFDVNAFDVYPFDTFKNLPIDPEYITINRASEDKNPWSCYNRWVHSEVIKLSAEANNKVPVYPADKRAKRPIVEFKADLKLYNFGSFGISSIDLIDTATVDALNDVVGTAGFHVDGVLLQEGHRVIFNADVDSQVRNKIFKVHYIIVNNSLRLELEIDTDLSNLNDSSLVVNSGNQYAGTNWWFNGDKWIYAQQHTKLNEFPLFDLFDKDGISYSNKEYYKSSFEGNKLFGYDIGTGKKDTVLGFSLNYQNQAGSGSYLFKNYFVADIISISSGFQKVEVIDTYKTFVKFVNKLQTKIANIWDEPIEKPLPILQLENYNYSTNTIKISVIDILNTSDKVDVYLENKKLDNSLYYTTSTNKNSFVTFVNPVQENTNVLLKIYTDKSPNSNGYYQVPLSLSNNPLNENAESFTLTELSDHVSSMIDSSQEFKGEYPGNSNLRDIPFISKFGVQLISNESPLAFAQMFIGKKEHSVFNAVTTVADHYNQFKLAFLRKLTELTDQLDAIDNVDIALNELNKDKDLLSPYYYSDMVAYGSDYTIRTFTVNNTFNTTYPISESYDPEKLSFKSVLVYLNDTQLILEKDYTFNVTDSVIIISKNLNRNDVIKIKEYSSTEGCFIPPTPSKLGLYPKFEPKIFFDESYAHGPQLVIQGHDGSIMIAYNDFRDQIILELEKRIYNNIKTIYKSELLNYFSILPGAFRNNDYSVQDINLILQRDFIKWAGIFGLDPYTNDTFDLQNQKTWNYANTYNYELNKNLFGTWRAVFNYFYDTDRPNTHPWEMLGFAEQPAWWEEEYGPAPYTSGNEILWQDIEKGEIKRGPNAGINTIFARPGLSNYLPVDEFGNLVDPTEKILTNITPFNQRKNWVFGDYSPVETAWRRSSYWPFAVQKLLILTKPAKYAALMYDPHHLVKNNNGQWIYNKTDTFLNLKTLPIFKQNDTLLSGYSVYISEVGSIKSSNYVDNLRNELSLLNVKLLHKVGGFISKDKIQILVDSYDPTSASQGGILPPENYKLVLNTSNPIKTVSISGIIIQKVDGKFVVRGYDQSRPFFTIFSPLRNFNTPTITVGGVSEPFVDWAAGGTGGNTGLSAAETTTAVTAATGKFYQVGQIVRYGNNYYRVKTSHQSGTTFNTTYFQILSALPTVGGATVQVALEFDKTPIEISYGTEFSNIQDLYDLIVGYGEWLKLQGFIFDQYNEELGNIIDWYYSGKEFLYWTTQNWANTSVITLSPFADKIKYSWPNSIVDNLFDEFYQYSILQSNGISMPRENLNVSRTDGVCLIETINTTDGIYFATLNSVQKEHAIIFDNLTIFNDTIYEPVTGYRQRRIKLSGFRTANWNGDYYSPGFVYDEAEVLNWKEFKNYNYGDVVIFNSKYYSAKQNILANSKFEFDKWIILDKKPEQSLIPNFDYKINQFEDFYSLDIDNFDAAQQKMAQHLIGYTPRTYLNNIFTNPIAQYKFYQGFIKEKGTKNSIQKLAKASQYNLQGELEYNEEWAFRIGYFGGFNSFKELEIPLTEGIFIENPQIINFVNTKPVIANDLIVYSTASDRVIVPNDYVPEQTFTTNQTEFKLEHAGYVRLDDVTATAYNENSLLDIANNSNIKDGDVIWLGFKNNGSWDVLRYSSLPFVISSVSLDLTNQTLKITTSGYHGFRKGQIISISQYTTELDGIYIVNSVTSLFEFTVQTGLTVIDTDLEVGAGLVFSFVPVRLNKFDNIFPDNLLLKFPVGTKVWVDNSGDGTWAVYEKTNNYQQPKSKNGWSLDKRNNSNVVVAGDPDNNLEALRGRVWVYKQLESDLQLACSYTLNDNLNTFYDTTNEVTELGYAVFYDSSEFNNTGYGLIFAGAPAVGKVKTDDVNGGIRFAYSTGTVSTRVQEGLVKISAIDPTLIEEQVKRVLLSPNPENYQRFGNSIFVQQNTATNKLVLIGAPGTATTGSGKVYVYNLATTTGTFAQANLTYLRELTIGVNTGSQFGFSISGSVDNNITAVSAPTFANNAGQVVVYSGTETSLLQVITPNVNQQGKFGTVVKVSDTGNYIFVTSPEARNADQSLGNVSVYYRTSNQGTFTLQTIITNPVPGAGMRFGSDLDINSLEDLVVIGALGTHKYVPTTFDEESNYYDDTTFDSISSKFYDNILDSGTAYVYERKDKRFVLANQLYSTSTAVKKYGASVLIDANNIYVGSLPNENQGMFYRFAVKDSTKHNWNKLRSQDSLVAVETIQKVTLIDSYNESILDYLDVIDPLKGKISGLAEQELKYKVTFDPAVYSIGLGATVVDTNTNWLDEHVGELWWDLSTAKYIWYEQGDLIHRKNNWGKLFPGATIDVYEWVGTPYLPSEWSSLADTPEGLTQGISGQPKYADNTVISVKQVYNSVTNSFTNYYYYWIKNKVTLPNTKNRRISSFQVASLIADPTIYGLKYAIILDSNAVALANISSLLVDKNIHLNIGIDEINNNIPRHTEWLLLQENNPQSVPNFLLEKKLIDSLLGHDSLGNVVPDPTLNERIRYGLSIRPRQGLFKNRLEALRNLIEFSNSILQENQITGRFNFNNLNKQENIPNVISGEYDQIVEDNEGLLLIDTLLLTTAELTCTVDNGKIRAVNIINPGFGYKYAPTVKVLDDPTSSVKIQTEIDNLGRIVNVTIKEAGNGFVTAPRLEVRPYTVIVVADNQYNGKWTKFAYVNKEWTRYSTQKFNTPLYWKYVDWISKDYNQYKDFEYTIEEVYQLETLSNLNDGQYVKIKNGGDGRYIIVEKISGIGSFSANFNLVYSEHGTIQILDSIWDYRSNNLGFDQNNSYDQTLFDQTPDLELEYILKALKEDIFVNELKINWNLFFFKAVKYALTEQKLLDWAFKTSFINVINRAGLLDQRPIYKLQNSEYYENYLKEVKPYRTNIRSFTTNYDVVDPSATYTTDFDLPPVFDKTTSKFNVIEPGSNILLNYPWKSWADNFTFEVGSISIGFGGEGYTFAPSVKLQTQVDDTGSGATAKAYIQSGKVVFIEVTNPGSGYKKPPIVILTGGGNTLLTSARAYAQLRNNKVRSTLIGIKLDRTGLGNTSGPRQVNDSFLCNGSTNEFILTWLANPDKLGITVKLDGAIVLSADYKIVYYTESFANYNKKFSKIVFLNYAPTSGQILQVTYQKNINLYNATERIINDYNPTTGMPGKDLAQLMSGMEYPKTSIEAISFDYVTKWGTTDNYDISSYASDVKDYKTISVAATASTGTSTLILSTLTGLTVGQNANIISYVTNKFSTSSNVQITAINTVTKAVTFNSTLSGNVITGDLIEFWKNDSNFSVLDSTIEAGTWSLTTSNYLVGALGVNPDDIIIQGDKFISENNSYAPEELVPGKVFDTLGINVYTKSFVVSPVIATGYFSAQANVPTTAKLSMIPTNKDSISVVFNNSTILWYSSTTNFTSSNQYYIDYSNGNIVVPPQSIDGIIGYTIVSIGGGSGNTPGILDHQIITVQNTISVTIASIANADTVRSVYVTLNGIKVPEISSPEQFGYMFTGTDQAAITIYNMEFGITKTIQVWFFADVYRYFNEVTEQLFNVGNTQISTFALTNLPGLSGPPAAQMIVEVSDNQNRRRLLPPFVYYYDVTNSINTTFAINPNETYFIGAFQLSNTKVYVNGRELRPGFDFSVDPVAATVTIKPNLLQVRDVVAIMGLVPNDIAVWGPIPGVYNYEYNIYESNLVLISPINNATLRVITFNNQDSMGMRTERFRGNPAKRYRISYPVMNDRYLWVTFNGIPLTSGLDFEILDDSVTVQIRDSQVHTNADNVVITSLSNNTIGNNIVGYRIFNDIFNRTHFKRLSRDNSTYLTQQLLVTDTEIHVADSSVLTPPIPSKKIPGVVLIAGERIEYLTMNNNILGTLRRGTLGTSPSAVVDINTKVIDQTFTQNIPFKEDILVQHHITTSTTNTYVISKISTSTINLQGQGITLSTATDIHAVNQVEVYYGGRLLNKTATYYQDTSVSYDIGTVNILGSTSSVQLLTVSENVKNGDSYVIQATNEVWTYRASNKLDAFRGYVFEGLKHTPAEFAITTATQELILNLQQEVANNLKLTIVKKQFNSSEVWNNVISSTETKPLLESDTIQAEFLKSEPAELPDIYYYGKLT